MERTLGWIICIQSLKIAVLNIDQMKLTTIKPIVIFFLFLTLGYGIYSNTLEAPFYFDDEPDIIENAHIRITNLSFSAIKNAGFNNLYSSRPIANISFALNYYFHQYNPRGYHVVNIIIHILTGILLYLFIKTTLSIPISKSSYTLIHESLNPAFIAFFTALIWLVNPVHTQSVTYIIQRENSMASMFFILSLWLYAKGRMIQHLQLTSLQHDKSSKLDTNTLAIKRKTAFSFQLLIPGLYLSGAVLSWILALGCKQTAATLPFFIFLYDWYFFQDLSKDWLKRQLKYLLVIFVLFGLIAFLYLGLNPLEKITSITDYANKEFTFAERVLTQPRVVIYYLSLIFFPHPARLNLDYDFPLSHSLIDPITTLFSLCIIFGLIGLAVYTAKKERLISFCILWFFGNLVIESSVIPLAIIFEHRTYLPSVLVCLLAVLLGYRLIKIRWLGVALICVVAAVFSFWTYQRNNIWRDPVALWSDCVAKSPQKARPHYNLGNALDKQDRIKEAIEHYLLALRIKSDFEEAHNNLGKALGKQGRTKEAMEHFIAALRIKPDHMEAHYNLGNALGRQGRVEEAIEHFREALRIKHDDEQVHYNLGIALFRTGNTQGAIDHFQEAIRIKPDFEEALYNLGNVLFQMGKTDEAIVHLKEALQMNPNHAGTHVSLGAALINKGEIVTAITHFKEALRLQPDYAAAQDNLMKASVVLRKIDAAIADIKTDLIFYPENPGLHYKLGKLYQSKGDLDAAADEYQKALSIEPEFAEALNNLALIYITKNENDKALSLLNKLAALQPDNSGHYYNLARIYAIKNLTQESIDWLNKAIEKGYNKWYLVKTDKNLENIRGSSHYKELIKGR